MNEQISEVGSWINEQRDYVGLQARIDRIQRLMLRAADRIDAKIVSGELGHGEGIQKALRVSALGQKLANYYTSRLSFANTPEVKSARRNDKRKALRVVREQLRTVTRS